MATMAQAKRDLQLGVIRGFRIDRFPLADNRKAIALLYTGAFPDQMLDDARTKQTRLFRTYDAAVVALEQIGFNVEHIGS